MKGHATVLDAIPAERRFQYRVWTHGDCWEWRGWRTAAGYGMFLKAPNHAVLAHRFSYEVAKGPIPPGYQIDHLCRHPWCVRPSHLEAVTPWENNRRGTSTAARHARQTHCKNGHPFDAVNTYVRIGGQRRCRICHAVNERKRA